MSSSGQPENNGLSRRQGFEARVRHPARRASLWRLLRTARRDRLGLSGSQRHVLAAIQDDLQADTELAAAFSLFTSATSGAAMPRIERLPTWRTLAGWRAGCRALLNRRIMLVVAVLVPFAALVALALAASSLGAQQTRCEPAYAFAPACHGPSWTPAGVQLQGSTLPPTYSYGRP